MIALPVDKKARNQGSQHLNKSNNDCRVSGRDCGKVRINKYRRHEEDNWIYAGELLEKH